MRVVVTKRPNASTEGCCRCGSSVDRLFAQGIKFEEVSNDYVFSDQERSAVACFIERGPPSWVADLKLRDHGTDWMTMEELPLLAMGVLPGEPGRVQNRCGIPEKDFLWHWKRYRSIELHWRRAYKDDPPVYDATPLLYLLLLHLRFEEPPPLDVLHRILLERTLPLDILQRTFGGLVSRGGGAWKEAVLRGVTWAPLRCRVYATKESLYQLVRAFPKTLLQKTGMWRNDNLNISSPRRVRTPECETEPEPSVRKEETRAETPECQTKLDSEIEKSEELDVAIANANYLARQNREARRAGAGYGTASGGGASAAVQAKTESEKSDRPNRRSRRSEQKHALSEGLRRKKEASASKKACDAFLRECRPALVSVGPETMVREDDGAANARREPRAADQGQRQVVKKKADERLVPGVVAQLFYTA